MIYVLLPAYNEEEAIEPLIAKVDAVMTDIGATYEVVVVDDGSSDDTGRVLASMMCQHDDHEPGSDNREHQD